MAPQPTPRLDAVRAWLASGGRGEIPWPQEEPFRWPDPVEWADADVRLEAALLACASGARAELPPRSTSTNVAVTARPRPTRRRPRWWRRKESP